MKMKSEGGGKRRAMGLYMSGDAYKSISERGSHSQKTEFGMGEDTEFAVVAHKKDSNYLHDGQSTRVYSEILRVSVKQSC